MVWTLRRTCPDRQRSRGSTSPPLATLHQDPVAPPEADNHGQLPDRNHAENNRSRTIRPPQPLRCLQPSQGGNPHATNLLRLQSRTSPQNPITPTSDSGRQTPRTTTRRSEHAPAREHVYTLLVHGTSILNHPGPHMTRNQDIPLSDGRESGNHRSLWPETITDHPNEPGPMRAKTKNHPSLSGPLSTSFTGSPPTIHGDRNVDRPTSK
jgi:hypothetical protein